MSCRAAPELLLHVHCDTKSCANFQFLLVWYALTRRSLVMRNDQEFGVDCTSSKKIVLSTYMPSTKVNQGEGAMAQATEHRNALKSQRSKTLSTQQRRALGEICHALKIVRASPFTMLCMYNHHAVLCFSYHGATWQGNAHRPSVSRWRLQHTGYSLSTYTVK